MLFGAFFAVLFTTYTQSPFLSVALAVVCVTFISLVFAFVVLDLSADPIITAFGVNLLGLGGTAYLLKALLGETGGMFAAVKLTRYKAEWLVSIPIIGPVLNKHTILTYMSLLLLPGVTYVLYRTVFENLLDIFNFSRYLFVFAVFCNDCFQLALLFG